MSTEASRPSAIERLLALFSQPSHDYRPATEVFLDLNVSRIADTLRLAQRGHERGTQNRPPTDAQTLDDVEHQILERIDSHKQDAHSLYLDHLQTYDHRLTALNFEERFATIQQAAPEAVGDFGAEAALGRDELFGLRRRVWDSERERDHFRARNKIARPARLSTPGKTVFKIGVLAVMFVIEVAMNGGFLSKSNAGGLLGGAIQATSFAALNIVASFLFGLVPIRLINRRQVFLKFLGLISLLAYLAFAVALNLTLSHLRDMPPTITGDIGHEVLLRLSQNPFSLDDVNSWAFFSIGFIFSLVAMADGLLFTDPYFGYAALERRCIEARDQYTDGKAALIDNLRGIRDTASNAMNEAARDLSMRRGEYDSILQARTRFSQRFIEHQNQIERSARALLAIYREANQAGRSQPAPKYFSQPYNLERIIYAGNEPNAEVRDKLAKSIEETQRLLAGQIQTIHEVFNSAVESYRQIDDLIPETMSGKGPSNSA
jgi:hypothetical protein